MKMFVNIIDSILRWVFFCLWIDQDTKKTRKNMAYMLMLSFALEFVSMNSAYIFTAYYAYEARRFTKFFDMKLYPQ